MGEVYRARDLRLGRSVALKFLRERNISDRDATERFLREARAASALNHPNIVTIYDVGDTASGRYIAMEFIEGQPLRSLATSGVPIEKLLDIGGQIAKALTVAHAAGVVHRDIKPENVMIRADGYVKVLDFGLARVPAATGNDDETDTGLGTNPGTLLGTVRYMSPEQGRGEAATAAADIFALGIVLYELVTGRHPFDAKSQIGVLHAILSDLPVPASRLRPGIPVALEALLTRMLEKDARLRPTAPEVELALAAYEDPAEAKPAPAAGLPVQRIVGRTKPLAELRSAFETAAAGRGLITCIAGEPGIGKTTLVEEFIAGLATHPAGCNVARGRCSERLAGSEAYLPLLEALESLQHGPAGDSITRCMKRVAPTWYVQIAPLAAEDSSFTRVLDEAKAASQERMKRELMAFLQEISGHIPLVIFFDDLHWADVSTVDLLSYLGSQCVSMRLLLVGTYRPSELLAAKHPLLPIKLEMQSHGVCREISLEFLTRDDIELYLALEFPENRFSPALAALIHAKTEGNPLFMTDLVRYLRDRGVIAEDQGRWQLAQAVPDVERDLPESVRSMIQRKIDRLTDADRRLLSAASVQGDEFDTVVVAKVLHLDPGEVEEHLDSLDKVHSFVKLQGESEFPDATVTLRYEFVHSLYQDALYGALTATRKVSLSLAVAQALLDFHGEKSTEIAAELALLFETGRDFARASDYFLMAAKNAMSVYAGLESIGLLQRAIGNAEKLREEARYTRVHRSAMQLARVYETVRRIQDALGAYDLADRSAAAWHDIDGQIQAICAKASTLIFMAKDAAGCQEHCRRAFELAQGQGSSESLAAVDMVRYLERICAGDFTLALECYDRALPVLREKGLSPANLLGLNMRGAFHIWRGETVQAIEVLDWSLEKAHAVGDLPRIVQNHFLRAMSLGRQGRLGEALEVTKKAQRLGELTGERVQLARFPNTLGWLYRELQDLEGALKLDLEGIRLTQEIGEKEAEINSQINAGQVYLLLGEPQSAFEHLQRADVLLGPFQWFKWVFQTRLELEWASYWIARSDTRQAAIHAQAALDITRRSLVRKYTAWAHRLLGDIATLEDRVEDARREYEAALGILAQFPCPGVEWVVRKSCAGLARKIGESVAAGEHTSQALVIVQGLADSVADGDLREKLLMSRAVGELKNSRCGIA